MLYGGLPAVKGRETKKVYGFCFNVENPPKSAVLRLPTSAEMIARIDGQKSIRQSLGRRESQSEVVPNPKADLSLFEALRVWGDDFDEFEARNAITKLTDIDVL